MTTPKLICVTQVAALDGINVALALLSALLPALQSSAR
jgi:hypothetical protein